MGLFDLFRGIPDEPPADAPPPTASRELLLYKYDACGYCRRVMRHLDELGLQVPMRDTLREPGARDALIEATGRTQVPCLFIDGEPLHESRDIMAWLTAYKQVLDGADVG